MNNNNIWRLLYVCMTCLAVVVGRDYVIIYARHTSTTVRAAYNKSPKIPLSLSFSPFLPGLVCETYTHVRIYTYRMFFIRLERVVFKTKKPIGSTTIQRYIVKKNLRFTYAFRNRWYSETIELCLSSASYSNRWNILRIQRVNII